MTDTNISLDQALAMKETTIGSAEAAHDAMVKLVVFTLDGEWFAFEGNKIKELLPDCTAFFLPGCPTSLEGVINVRGSIESVINLRSVVGRPPSPSGALRGRRNP